jgi:hypothetical protein
MRLLPLALLAAAPFVVAPAGLASPAPRDPFAPFAATDGATACAPGPAVVCTGLGRLTVRALVTGMASPRALLEDDAGRSHLVRVGDVVDGHRVKAVRRDGLVLERSLRDWQGRLLRHDVVLGLGT